jgi:ORF6N domain-containing protein
MARMSATSTAVAEIEERILTLRGRKVLLDSDLAALYGVSTKVLLQAVRRNRSRFPSDFLFQLSIQEVRHLRSQIVTSSSGSGHGGRRYHVYALTEQGVAMLSSVLRSRVAIAVNIEIMRAFVRLRRAALVSEQVIGLIAELAKRVDDHDAAIRDIIETIRTLIDAPKPSRRAIGFVPID